MHAYHSGALPRPKLTQMNLLPPQNTQNEPVQSATEYFEEIASKVLRHLPEKTEKSLNYWLGRTNSKKCNIHPEKLSKTCR